MSFRPFAIERLAHALVIKLRHHGDVLLTSPVFTVLKQAAPQCDIDALIYDETIEMLEGHPAISRIHSIGRRWKTLGPFERLREEKHLLTTLIGRHYDLIIHLTDGWRGAWLARMLRPGHSVATYSPLRPPGRFWASSFSHLAPQPPFNNRHTVEIHLDTLRILGIQPRTEDRRLTFHVTDVARQQVEKLLSPHEIPAGRLIHIHPTSRWMFKAWTAAGYAEVISGLFAQGFTVVLTTGPAAREKAFAAEIVAYCRTPPIDLSGQLTLKQLGALIERCRLSICIDSAPMHIAAAVGTPVVALFGPSNEHEWGPWMVPQRVLVSRHACRPCRLDGCGGGKISECLSALRTEEVLAAVDSLLTETA